MLAPPAYKAELATLVDVPPEGDGWLHEQKFDGYRIGARIARKTVELWSRRAQDWTSQFAVVARACQALPARQALLDGEVAAVLPSGITSFQALQNRGAGGAQLVYFAFDLLHLDGRDVTDQPIEDRKQLLKSLLPAAAGGVIRYSDHVVGGGIRFHGEACRAGLEGIVSKRLGTPYRPGRGLDWQKTKCIRRQEFVIGGFTEPEGSREGVGALLIGYYDGDRLRWAGKVGTGAGWNATYLRDLRRRLDAIATTQAPFEPAVADAAVRRTARWVAPRLIAEVAFTEWTEDGRIRHPSMQGLRSDKTPREVRRETPVAKDQPRGPRRPRRAP